MRETMKIYDGSAEAKNARKKAKSWNGFHLLLTAPARRAVMLSSLKIPMLIVFIVGLAAGIAAGAGVGFGLGFGAALALVIYMDYQNDVYKKLYSPERDQGVLTLPEGMTWEQAVEHIRHGFAHPDVEQVTDTPEDIIFHSKKRGTYQLKNTPDGLRMTILAKPSRSGKKEYLYAVFSSMLLSQVIALLYPEMISAAQVEEEKAQVNKLFRRHGLPMLIEWVIGIVLLAVMGWMLYMALYSDAARSKGLSEGHYSAFPAEATVGEVLDDFFVNGKWDNYEQSGATFVSYTGECADAQTGGTITMGFYFKLEEDGSFSMDRMTWNGDTMNLLEQYAVLSKISESYCQHHGIANSGSNPLDDALDSLDDILNDAASTTAESEGEVESTVESASEPEAETSAEEPDTTDEEETGLITEDRKVHSTNGIDTYWELAGDISAFMGTYESGQMTEEDRAYFQSYSSKLFFTQWQNAMYTDVDEYHWKYGALVGWHEFVTYLNFYDDVASVNGLNLIPSEYYDVLYSVTLDPTTDDEAEPYVNEVVDIAENNGAEIQIW